MPWTEQQQEVIDTRDCDMLVSAAAGSGKTAVLVERIIQKITDDEHPLDVDRLLVVTYTHAAADEMKERISKAIEKKLEEDPTNEHLIQQTSLIRKASITTIHSFCLDLIRDYFFKLDLDPSFSIGEESQLTLLKQEVLDEILEEAYEKKEEGFLQFIESYIPGKKDDQIGALILNLYESSRSQVDPMRWLEEARAGFAIQSKEDLEQAFWMNHVIEDTKETLETALELIDLSMDLAGEEEGPMEYWDALQSDRNYIIDAINSIGYEELGNSLLSIEKTALTKPKNITDETKRLMGHCKYFRDEVYQMIDAVKGSYFYTEVGEVLRQIKSVRPAMEGFVDLTKRFYQRYEERKKQENLLDFGDMEHFALKLLVERYENGILETTEIAKEKAAFFEEIYTDEYQDSNFIQDAILRSVSKEALGGHNMFMVGDVKQSIYSFRLARPELFIQKYNKYQEQDPHSKLIELRNNFRSRKEVLEFTNDIFYKIMHKNLGNIDYTEDVALVPSFPYEEGEGLGGVAEILLLGQEIAKNQKEDSDTLEAKMIAHRIHELVDGEHPQMVMDEDEDGNPISRKAEYKDIVILMRSPKSSGETFQQVLMNDGIPAFCNAQSGYFDTVEIRSILSLLTVVDNVYVDIDMAAYLRSPMIGMTGNNLAKLRMCHEKASLYECLMTYKKENEKAKKALEILETLRSEKNHASLYDLIWKALQMTDYYHYIGAMPQGDKRQGNVRMLLERARNYESSQYKGLFHFIRYIKQCKEYDLDFGEANTLGENENLVSITSIHKSKGLEYPIVILAKMQKRFNLMDASGSIIFHPDYYIGPDVVNIKNRTKSPSILKGIISRQIKKDSLGEELRILYVAMTRAKEKLIMTGIQPTKAVTNKVGGVVPAAELMQGSSYLSWVFMALNTMEKQGCQLTFVGEEALSSWNLEQMIKQNIKKEDFMTWVNEKGDEEKIKDYESQFAHVYPYEAESRGKLKYSVSEIKRLSQAHDTEEEFLSTIEEKEPIIPRFMKPKQEVSPTSRGTAVHKVFELMDLKKSYSKGELQSKLEEWIQDGKIDESTKEVIPLDLVLKFHETSLGQRVKDASSIYKERQFVMGVPFSQMEPNAKGDQFVVVQGIIDMYFEEEDGLVIVDYKTDRVRPGMEQVLIDHYKSQLDYYQLALEQMTGKKVKECYIYSVPLCKEILV